MAVIINELEVVLESPEPPPQPGGHRPPPEQPLLNLHDLSTLIDREKRISLRTWAH